MKQFTEKDTAKQKAVRRSRTAQKRTLIKSKGSIPQNALKGLVVAYIGKFIIVTDFMDGITYECYLAGTLISPNGKSSLVAVGDNVFFILDKYENETTATGLETGVIVAVDERQSLLARKSPANPKRELVLASNSNYLLLIMSAKSPKYNRRLLDRFAIAAEMGKLDFAICLNKMDLLTVKEEENELFDEFAVYEDLGNQLFFISATEDDDDFDEYAELKKFIRGKRGVFAGPSGVGKSTLVNKLLGETVQMTNEISERTDKGCHTTSSVKMFELEGDTQIIDTPGIREFALSGLDKEELYLYFHDFDEFFPECKYHNCTHIHEPGCAVREAVENGEIDAERYESYINIYNTIKSETY